MNQEFVENKVNLLVGGKIVCGEWIACSRRQYDVLWLLKHGEVICDGLDVKVITKYLSTWCLNHD